MRSCGWSFSVMIATVLGLPAHGQEWITPFPTGPIINPNLVPIAPAVPPPGYPVMMPGRAPMAPRPVMPIQPVMYGPPVAVANPPPCIDSPRRQDAPISVLTPVQKTETLPARPANDPALSETPLNGSSVEDIVRQTIIELEGNKWGCCPPCHGWRAGYELTLLRAYFDDRSNGFVSALTTVNQPIRISFSAEEAPEYDLKPANRVWLRYTGPNGFGVRIRYWQFNQQSSPAFVTGIQNDGNGPFSAVSLNTSLEMHSLDTELTLERTLGFWDVLASAGVRLAKLQRTAESVNLFDPPTGAGEHELRTMDDSLEAYGLTTAVEGRRHLLGGLFAFVSARGSVLAGDLRSRRTRFSLPGDNAPPGTTVINAQRTDESLVVGELQVGLEWERNTRLGQWFLRAALEGQYWREAGFVLSGIEDRNSFAETRHDDLTLLGLALATGIHTGGPAECCGPDASDPGLAESVRRAVDSITCNSCSTCYCLDTGFELTFIRPHFDDFSNGQVIGISQAGAPSTQFQIDLEPEYHLNLAPRFWVALSALNGAGVRGRYFHLDHEASAAALQGGSFGSNQLLETHFKMRVADVELTCQKQSGPWTILVAGGVRYAHLRRNDHLLSTGNDNSFATGESQEIDFEGYGPTVALEGRRSVWGSLSAFASARGSLLAGDTMGSSNNAGFENGLLTGGGFNTDATNNSLLVGEFQVGLELAKCIRNAQVFIRGGFEAQYWLDGGHVLPGLEGELPTSPHDDLTLVGILVGGGIRR